MACCTTGTTWSTERTGWPNATGSGLNFWPTTLAPLGARAFSPTWPSIWVATLAPRPLNESRRDLASVDEPDNSPPFKGPMTLSESSLANAQTDSSWRWALTTSATARALATIGS